VSFDAILKKCKASEVVALISRLHSAFNRICRVHGVFRVSLYSWDLL
jgi:hypothetical protein